jgi:hypothetical protein
MKKMTSLNLKKNYSAWIARTKSETKKQMKKLESEEE